jgi:hypothetical protein
MALPEKYDIPPSHSWKPVISYLVILTKNKVPKPIVGIWNLV